MTRSTTLLIAVVLVIGSVSAFPMAAAAQSGSSTTAAIGDPAPAQVNENASENATNVTPGERLSGILGVGQAEFEGEMELRTYGIEYAKANSNESKADVVNDRLDRIEERLNELEQRKADLREARENGTISDGEFQARMAELAAQSESVEQLANASEDRANSLPADVLESKGINVTAIQMLKTNAENLSGGEVAQIAMSIAGPDVGQSVSQGPPSEIGIPAGPGTPGQDGDGDGNATEAAIDRAEEQLDAAETRIEQAEERVGQNASENATDALEQARAELERARSALEDARNAFEAGNQTQALELAEDALAHAEQAEAHAQDAIDAAQPSGQDGAGGTEDGNDGQGEDY